MSELTIARERFEQSLALYRPEMHDCQIAQYGTDLGVAGHCYHALTLWHLGYPDQAVEGSYRSMTLAQDGAHPFSQAYALFVSAWVPHLRRAVSAPQPQAEAASRLATEQELLYGAALSGLMRGWSLARQGPCFSPGWPRHRAGTASEQQSRPFCQRHESWWTRTTNVPTRQESISSREN